MGTYFKNVFLFFYIQLVLSLCLIFLQLAYLSHNTACITRVFWTYHSNCLCHRACWHGAYEIFGLFLANKKTVLSKDTSF